jgi:hypothetical protein
MSINSMQDGDMVGDTDESLPLGRTCMCSTSVEGTLYIDLICQEKELVWEGEGVTIN